MSSLRELTVVSLDTAFAQRGRCYLSNCYREDYLQVAFMDPVIRKLLWYKCSDNRKMYIPK